jgi:hypothetical protein
MGNVLIILQVLSGLLTVVGQASVQVQRINALLVKLQAEGRDATEEERDAIAIETDNVIRDAVAFLRGQPT